jgi:hypothetical protein
MAITRLEARGGDVSIYRPWAPYSSDPCGIADILLLTILRRPFHYVDLDGETATTKDMHDLVILSRIDHLDLQDLNINGHDLQVLSEMSYVRDLNLLDVSIVDADLTHLERIYGLREVNLTGSEVSDTAVRTASKRMPDVLFTKYHLNIKNGKPVIY